MKRRNDSLYLKHVLDASSKISKYLRGVDESQFSRNTLLQDAVIRQLEIIGEAVKRLSPSFRSKYPDYPWKDVAGMRDKLIHDYFGVDLDAVWLTAKKDIPVLKKKVSEILRNQAKMGSSFTHDEKRTISRGLRQVKKKRGTPLRELK